MDKSVAKALLESLLQRMERVPETGQLRLPGPVSSGEFGALRVALELLGGTAPNEPVLSAPPAHILRDRAERLNIESLKSQSSARTDVLLCLDFGTAMSKAAATRGDKKPLVALPLGRQAGDETSPFGLQSSLYISNSGRVYFGCDALTKSNAESGSGRRRFDSIKQRLSQGTLETLMSGRLEPEINPTQVPFTNADMVLAYLAYFTDIATSALAADCGERYSTRRFARPCWEPTRLGWAEGELRKMLAKAQILADTFSEKWKEGIPADVLKATIDSVNELQQLPDHLVDRGLPEPVAAAASRVVSEEERDRGLFVVVDIGAGTSDYAAFWTDQDQKIGRFKIWQIGGSVDAIAQAGDTIDGFLHAMILEKAHVRPGSVDYPFAATQLALGIRENKELLMNTGSLETVLSNGSKVIVTKDEFEKSQPMLDLSSALRDKFESSLRATHESWANKVATFKRNGRDEISVVLTGGGAGLSMVQALAKGYVDVHGHRLGLRHALDVPAWITEDYEKYVSDYQRLAVAIGGAARELPELAEEAAQFDAQTDGTRWEPTVTYR
ncbi:MAG: hypothetical protein Q7S69_02930 [Nitrosomonadaceae bacterium]|nr:hypothetical protein [Nitrosomonadaceae bacterium]